jgi:hypothetical protein
MTIWDLGLIMMHQVIGAVQWHIALMIQGLYFVTWFGLEYMDFCVLPLNCCYF